MSLLSPDAAAMKYVLVKGKLRAQARGFLLGSKYAIDSNQVFGGKVEGLVDAKGIHPYSCCYVPPKTEIVELYLLLQRYCLRLLLPPLLSCSVMFLLQGGQLLPEGLYVSSCSSVRC
jgi:hypothetical protein